MHTSTSQLPRPSLVLQSPPVGLCVSPSRLLAALVRDTAAIRPYSANRGHGYFRLYSSVVSLYTAPSSRTVPLEDWESGRHRSGVPTPALMWGEALRGSMGRGMRAVRDMASAAERAAERAADEAEGGADEEASERARRAWRVAVAARLLSLAPDWTMTVCRSMDDVFECTKRAKRDSDATEAGRAALERALRRTLCWQAQELLREGKSGAGSRRVAEWAVATAERSGAPLEVQEVRQGV